MTNKFLLQRVEADLNFQILQSCIITEKKRNAWCQRAVEIWPSCPNEPGDCGINGISTILSHPSLSCCSLWTHGDNAELCEILYWDLAFRDNIRQCECLGLALIIVFLIHVHQEVFFSYLSPDFSGESRNLITVITAQPRSVNLRLWDCI